MRLSSALQRTTGEMSLLFPDSERRQVLQRERIRAMATHKLAPDQTATRGTEIDAAQPRHARFRSDYRGVKPALHTPR